MTLRAAVLLLVLLGAGPAATGPYGVETGMQSGRAAIGHRGTDGRLRSGRGAIRTRGPDTGLREFTAESRLRGGVELRETRRIIVRRSDRLSLGPSPAPAEIEGWRARALRAEGVDERRSRLDLEVYQRLRGPLGPVTRRVLERSALDLRFTRSRAAVEAEARRLEADAHRARPGGIEGVIRAAEPGP